MAALRGTVCGEAQGRCTGLAGCDVAAAAALMAGSGCPLLRHREQRESCSLAPRSAIAAVHSLCSSSGTTSSPIRGCPRVRCGAFFVTCFVPPDASPLTRSSLEAGTTAPGVPTTLPVNDSLALGLQLPQWGAPVHTCVVGERVRCATVSVLPAMALSQLHIDTFAQASRDPLASARGKLSQQHFFAFITHTMNDSTD